MLGRIKKQVTPYHAQRLVLGKISGAGWSKTFSFCGHLDVRAFSGLTDFTYNEFSGMIRSQ